tara:strand:+ start:32 stop:217 length:186 start_codon:yes stop_codon:yes gene_type:complete
LSIPEVKLEEDTPEDIVLVAIKFNEVEPAVSNPLALALKANPELATVVKSKLLKLNLVNAI